MSNLQVVAPPDEGGDGAVNRFAAFLRSTSKLEEEEGGEGGGEGGQVGDVATGSLVGTALGIPARSHILHPTPCTLHPKL